jgi:chemosensory pili system protein ChpB (putative protein-glutamate methylesterase)
MTRSGGATRSEEATPSGEATTSREALGSPAQLVQALAGTGYLADQGLATAGWLALRMDRPLFLEGEAGVGYVLRAGFDLPPLMFSEAAHRGSNKRWIQSLAEKLQGSVGAAVQVDHGAASRAVPPMPEPTRIKSPVWVLGASFGGPEAVKRFLSLFAEAPDAVFILAQHIGEGFHELLAQQLNRSTAFSVAVAEEGMALEAGRIFVVPVFHRMHIDENDCFHLVVDRPERVSYSPSIDNVMTEVANRFGPRSGAVIFSGMGDDGVLGCRALVGAGGVVWAQDSDSCAIDSMPARARDTGLVSHVADPEQLAADLARHLDAEAQSARASQRG